MGIFIPDEKTVEISISEYRRLIESAHLVKLIKALYKDNDYPSNSTMRALLFCNDDYDKINRIVYPKSDPNIETTPKCEQRPE